MQNVYEAFLLSFLYVNPGPNVSGISQNKRERPNCSHVNGTFKHRTRNAIPKKQTLNGGRIVQSSQKVE
jgi:hypothetical protein